MRSIIGLLAALLVLPVSYSRLPPSPTRRLASIIYEKVIACATRYPHVDAYKWSSDHSEFVRVYVYRPPIYQIYLMHQRFAPPSAPDCGFESIAQLCRSSYDNVSYGKEMNETKTFVVERFWYEKREYGHSYSHKNETVEAKLFKCQDYIRAEEPSVPEGSWSDRLSTASVSSGKCKSEGDWIRTAKHECGATPTHFNLGAKCGDRAEYLEIIFVCDAPKNTTIFEAGKEFLEHREEYFHNSQFAVLQRYAELAEKLMEASAKNKTESVEIYKRKLAKVSSTVADTIRDAHNLTSLSTVQRNSKIQDISRDYDSRQRLFARAKYAIRNIAIERSEELFHLAVTLLSNGTIEQKIGFDVASMRFMGAATLIHDMMSYDKPRAITYSPGLFLSGLSKLRSSGTFSRAERTFD
uniref:DUF1977 domain-containing protein n=1 Tax=Steinernema glaseri TaxID=37863 RepID=A0A1I7ZBF9_9BILA